MGWTDTEYCGGQVSTEVQDVAKNSKDAISEIQSAVDKTSQEVVSFPYVLHKTLKPLADSTPSDLDNRSRCQRNNGIQPEFQLQAKAVEEKQSGEIGDLSDEEQRLASETANHLTALKADLDKSEAAVKSAKLALLAKQDDVEAKVMSTLSVEC